MNLKKTLIDWKYPPRIVGALFQGISKTDLNNLVAEVEDLEVDSVQVEVARMNLVGSLRSVGVIIPKVRGFYQIDGYEKPREKVPANEWTGKAREVLDWVYQLPELSTNHVPSIQTSLLSGEETLFHERSLGYIYCYEVGSRGTSGYLYTSGRSSNQAIVLQRFTSQPRMRIFQLSLNVDELLRLARLLAHASLRPIRVINVGPALAGTLKGISRLQASFTSRREAVYHCRKIASHPERFWNKRGLSTLRKHERETAWREAVPADRDDMKWVVKTWKEHLEQRHRQLAISRDFVSVDLFSALEMPSFIGEREVLHSRKELKVADTVPVCIHIFSQIPGMNAVSLITEKSLNYRGMLGGRFGTADYNLFKACQWLADRGTDLINAGTYEGGGIGLPSHKSRFAQRENDVLSLYVDLFGIPWKETEFYN